MSQLDMLTGLLRKEAKSDSINAHLKGTFSEETRKPVLEISQSPKMNLFKVSGGIQDVPENSKDEVDLAQHFLQKQAHSRHINLNKNDYLNKLFNDIKKSQLNNSEKKGKEEKEEVFNDTFGQGGPDPEGNKENLTPQPHSQPSQSDKDGPSPQNKRAPKTPNIFKQMKKSQTEVIYEKISGKSDQLRAKMVSASLRIGNKAKTDMAPKTGRKCVLSIEKDKKKKQSKRSSKAKKMKNMKFGDMRRAKMNT